MSELSSRPAREPVVYTLEQVATIPEKQWHAFVLAVTETFWQLPEALRPQNAYFGSLTRASELFPVTDTLAFYSRSADGLWPVNVTIEREHRQNILVLKELNFGRQPRFLCPYGVCAAAQSVSGLFPHSFHCRWCQLVTAAEMDKTVPGA